MTTLAGTARTPINYDLHRETAANMRAEVVHDALSRGATAVMPSRRALRNLGLAFLIATGAFWAIMLQDPPTTVAADPSVAAQTISPLGMNIPAELPSGAYDAY